MLSTKRDKKTKCTLIPVKSYEKIVQKKDPGNHENFAFLPKGDNRGNCRTGTYYQSRQRAKQNVRNMPITKIVIAPEYEMGNLAQKGQVNLHNGMTGRIFGRIE